MKKLVTALFFCALASVQLNAQSTTQTYMESPDTGFYIGVHGGYNLGIAHGGDGWSDIVYNEDGSETRKSVSFSYGEGANFGLDLGYMFNKNIGAEIGVDYLKGSKKSITENGDFANYSAEYELDGQMLLIQPKIVVKANPNTVTPYAKFGLVIGAMPKVTENYVETQDANTYSDVFEMDGGMSVGVTGALGIDYALSPNTSIYTEIRSMAMSYKPEKGTYTERIYNGESVLDQFNYSQNNYEYVDQYNTSENEDPDSATKDTKLTHPFSNVGINVGFKYSF